MLTSEEAREMYSSDVWHNWSDIEIVKFQLFEDLVCLNWERFHDALNAVLGRKVLSSEFGDRELLRKEYLTLIAPPIIEEVIARLPQEKLIGLNIDQGNGDT